MGVQGTKVFEVKVTQGCSQQRKNNKKMYLKGFVVSEGWQIKCIKFDLSSSLLL